MGLAWSLSGPAFSPSASSPSTSRISSPTSDLELVPHPLQVEVLLLQLLPLLRRLPKKKRRKSLRKNPMTTWDSDFLTKVLGSNSTLLFFSTEPTMSKKRSSLLSTHITTKNNFVLCICDLNIE